MTAPYNPLSRAHRDLVYAAAAGAYDARQKVSATVRAALASEGIEVDATALEFGLAMARLVAQRSRPQRPVLSFADDDGARRARCRD